MRFIENLQKKITINRLAEQVIRSWGTPDNSQGMDRQVMESLLAMSDLNYQRERDLDLYYRDQPDGRPLVMVLDNELKLYHTSIADVAMRKSPTVKEMVSIRNAIKILNDKDVSVSRKADSVRWLQQELIDALDLSFTPADIASLADDGRAALANHYPDGVVDMLTLMAEMLGFSQAPKAFDIPHCRIWGALETASDKPTRFGPLVIFNQINNHLALVRSPASSEKPEDIQRITHIAQAKTPADVQGEAVWQVLAALVLEKHPDAKSP